MMTIVFFLFVHTLPSLLPSLVELVCLFYKSTLRHTPNDLQQHLERSAVGWASIGHLGVDTGHKLLQNSGDMPLDTPVQWVERKGQLLQPDKDNVKIRITCGG